MNPVFFWVVFVVAVILLVDGIGHRIALAKTKSLLDHVSLERDVATVKRDKAKRDLSDIIVTVTPLVEKTDWMTGRWGGQFETLVRLEKERNDRVESVRRIISNSVAVQDIIESGRADTLVPDLNGIAP